MGFKDLLELEKPIQKEKCKGRIYRGRVSSYVGTRNEYVYQEKMVFLKRKSCGGCEQCGYLEEYLNEFAGDIGGNLPIIEEIEDGSLYELKVVNESRDWESGIIDDWDIEFCKIK